MIESCYKILSRQHCTRRSLEWDQFEYELIIIPIFAMDRVSHQIGTNFKDVHVCEQFATI